MYIEIPLELACSILHYIMMIFMNINNINGWTLYFFSPESRERFIPSHTGEQSLSGHAVRPTDNQTVAQNTSLTEVPPQDITFVGRGCLTPQRQLMKKFPGRIPFRVTRTYTAKRRNGHYLTPILGGTPVKNPDVTAIYSRNEGII